MRRGRLVGRRDAHQPLDRETVNLAATGDEGIRLGRQHAALLRFLAGIDLHEEPRGLAHPRSLACEFLGQALAIERLNDIEELDRLARLVRLQRADHVQFGIGEALLQRRPLRLGFLHIVLAEDTLPGFEHLGDLLGRLGLRDRDQRDRASFTPEIALGAADRRPNLRQTRNRIAHLPASHALHAVDRVRAMVS